MLKANMGWLRWVLYGDGSAVWRMSRVDHDTLIQSVSLVGENNPRNMTENENQATVGNLLIRFQEKMAVNSTRFGGARVRVCKLQLLLVWTPMKNSQQRGSHQTRQSIPVLRCVKRVTRSVWSTYRCHTWCLSHRTIPMLQKFTGIFQTAKTFYVSQQTVTNRRLPLNTSVHCPTREISLLSHNILFHSCQEN